MKRPETHWFIKHPDYVAAIQVTTQDDVTPDDVVSFCVEFLGIVPPTSIAVGKPENVVWTQT